MPILEYFNELLKEKCGTYTIKYDLNGGHDELKRDIEINLNGQIYKKEINIDIDVPCCFNYLLYFNSEDDVLGWEITIGENLYQYNDADYINEYNTKNLIFTDDYITSGASLIYKAILKTYRITFKLGFTHSEKYTNAEGSETERSFTEFTKDVVAGCSIKLLRFGGYDPGDIAGSNLIPSGTGITNSWSVDHLGWSETKNGYTGYYNNGAEYTPTRDITLYAVWTRFHDYTWYYNNVSHVTEGKYDGIDKIEIYNNNRDLVGTIYTAQKSSYTLTTNSGKTIIFMKIVFNIDYLKSKISSEPPRITYLNIYNFRIPMESKRLDSLDIKNDGDNILNAHNYNGDLRFRKSNTDKEGTSVRGYNELEFKAKLTISLKNIKGRKFQIAFPIKKLLVTTSDFKLEFKEKHFVKFNTF